MDEDFVEEELEEDSTEDSEEDVYKRQLLMFVAFTVFRLPYANLIAVLTALLAYIPYIGADVYKRQP